VAPSLAQHRRTPLHWLRRTQQVPIHPGWQGRSPQAHRRRRCRPRVTRRWPWHRGTRGVLLHLRQLRAQQIIHRRPRLAPKLPLVFHVLEWATPACTEVVACVPCSRVGNFDAGRVDSQARARRESPLPRQWKRANIMHDVHMLLRASGNDDPSIEGAIMLHLW
jgi:hypothetical protein